MRILLLYGPPDAYITSKGSKVLCEFIIWISMITQSAAWSPLLHGNDAHSRFLEPGFVPVLNFLNLSNSSRGSRAVPVIEIEPLALWINLDGSPSEVSEIILGLHLRLASLGEHIARSLSLNAELTLLIDILHTPIDDQVPMRSVLGNLQTNMRIGLIILVWCKPVHFIYSHFFTALNSAAWHIWLCIRSQILLQKCKVSALLYQPPLHRLLGSLICLLFDLLDEFGELIIFKIFGEIFGYWGLIIGDDPLRIDFQHWSLGGQGSSSGGLCGCWHSKIRPWGQASRLLFLL